MKKRLTEQIEHPPAAEFAHGLCVVNTFESMLNRIGIADQTRRLLSAARERRAQEMEAALGQRVDFTNKRLSRFDFLVSEKQMDDIVDEQSRRTAAVAVRADGMRIKQLYLEMLTDLKMAGLLPNDATLTFDSSDLPSAYGLTKRDLIIGARVMFTLNGRVFSHIFHLGFEEKPPYYHDLSDPAGSGIRAIMDRAIEGAPASLDTIMQNPARLGRTWNVVALYPGLENVRRLRAR